jgi:hypothetical protein
LFAVKHPHVVGDNLNCGALDTFSVGILTLLQTSFNVDFRAFVEVPLTDFGKLPPGDDLEPFGFLFGLAVSLVPAIDRKGKLVTGIPSLVTFNSGSRPKCPMSIILFNTVVLLLSWRWFVLVCKTIKTSLRWMHDT